MCRPFIVCNKQVGLIRPDVIVEIMKYPEAFLIRDVLKDDKTFEVCSPANHDRFHASFHHFRQ